MIKKNRTKLLCRSARQTAQLAAQLESDNTQLLRRKTEPSRAITKRQISMGGPLTAGDAGNQNRVREAKERPAEVRRRKKQISKDTDIDASPTPAPRPNGTIFDP
jgi:hypothetical protein